MAARLAPHETRTMTSQPEPPTQHGGGFFTWLRGLGVNRGGDRWFAGVAGGLAARAGIDPLIVRGIFIVLAIVGGPALLIYAAGWLLLPNGTGRIHMEDIVRGRADSGVITVAVIAGAALVLPILFLGINTAGFSLGWPLSFGAWDLWEVMGLPGWLSATMAWLFWLALIIGGAFWVRHYLIGRGNEQNSRPAQQQQQATQTPQTPQAATFVAGPAPDAAAPTTELPQAEASPDWTQNLTDQANRLGEKAQHLGDKAGQWGQEAGQRVDAWSSRFAEEHAARKLGAGHILITLAFAFLAAGAAAFMTLDTGFEFTPTGSTVAVFTAPLVAAIIAALAVLALSLIVAGVRGRNTGIIGFLSFCGVVALLITTVLPWGTRFQPFGDLKLDGGSIGSVSIAGNVDINLRDLDRNLGLGHAPPQPTDLVVWHGAGDINIAMPESAPTVVTVHMLAGVIDDFKGADNLNHVTGPLISRTVSANLPRGSTAATAKNTNQVTVYMLAGQAIITTPPEAAIAKERAS